MDDANFTHPHDIQAGNVTRNLTVSYSLRKREKKFNFNNLLNKNNYLYLF